MREGCFYDAAEIHKEEAHLSSYSAQLISHTGCLDCVQEDSLETLVVFRRFIHI